MTSQMLRISALALALLAAGPVLAQEASETTEAAPATTQDEGTDWGWIGLLGLIGLAGLRGRRNDTTTTRH